MALDLANSFLVVASQSAGETIDTGVLAYHYPTHRSREYCKEVTYVRTEEGSIELRVSVLETDSKPRTPGRYRRFRLSDRCDYVRGKALSRELTDIVIRDGWKMEEVGAFLERYLGIIGSLAGETGQDIRLEDITAPLCGRFFDLIPRNMIIGVDGEIHAVDQEWDYAGKIPLGLLVFRALIQLLYAKFRFGRTASEFRRTRMGFMIAAFNAAGFEVTEEDILSYAKLETASQSEVAQRTLSIAEVFAPHSSIHFKTMAEAYCELSERFAVSDEAAGAKSAGLSERKGESRPVEGSGGSWRRLWRRFRIRSGVR
jgi:hypothetical protein